MMIALLLITIFITLGAAGVSGYAMHITSMIEGEKLLTLDSTLGYKYATTYHTWQIAAMVAVGVAVFMWIIFIITLVRRSRKKKREKIEKLKSKV